MASTKHKLRLAGAFAALATLALAVSCTGFFVNPTVSTITVDPPTPSVAVGTTLQLTAAATYSDGSTGTLSGGTGCTGNTVCWTSSDTTVATISTGGLMTGVATGTTTITAANTSITGTTTGTVVETVSSMTITPSSDSIVDNGGSAGGFVDYTIEGVTPGGSQNISGLATVTPYTGGLPSAGGQISDEVSCVYDGVQFMVCTPQSEAVTTTTTFTMVVTYSGYTGTAVVSAQLTVTPD
jgi:hypothetical protein